jgi:Zn-dependent protease
MDLGPEQIRWIIQGMIILILSIAVHEFGHAFVADKLGDPTPRSQGRVTLNPAAHADPIGTLLFPMLGLLLTGGQSFGFGWGRPVLVSPVRFTRKLRMRTSHMLVAAAGPAMNIVLGVVVGVLHVALVRGGVLDAGDSMNTALAYAVSLNFILAFFNLIPAPPLDGGAVLEGLLPDSALDTWRRIAVYGPFILMAVIFIPQLSDLFLGPALWLHRNVYALLGIHVGYL